MSRPRVLSSLRRDYNEAALELKEFAIDQLNLTKRKLSRMRDSINLDKKGKATTDKGKIARIRNTRGAFLWLPVRYDNDLVHGSWWFVYGSLISTLIPVIPLLDIHLHFFSKPENTVLDAFANSSTWIFLIISGIFGTIGSWVFIRAFEHPPPEPLFPNIHHICTDELLGAWLFLVAMIPAIPYSIVFLVYEPKVLTYTAALCASILFVVGSAFFVYTCYPSVHDQFYSDVPSHYVLPIIEKIFGKTSSLCRHCKTDWLVSCWLMYYSTFLWMFGSYMFLFTAENDRQLFVWLTGFFNALVFLIGCAYYVSGSYQGEYEHEEFDQLALDFDDDGSILAYFSNLGKKKKRYTKVNSAINPIHDSDNNMNDSNSWNSNSNSNSNSNNETICNNIQENSEIDDSYTTLVYTVDNSSKIIETSISSEEEVYENI